MSEEMDRVTLLDCKGMLCPMPIYRTSMALTKLSHGQILKVVCTDPGAVKDFPAFARQGGHELVGATQEEGSYIFLIRKGGAA